LASPGISRHWEAIRRASHRLWPQLRRLGVRSAEDDLEPIRLSYLNENIGLDAEQARGNSPLLNLPRRATKLIIAYGSDELPELKRQLREFAAAW
jgi:hypothetical protein